jgi:L-aspartate oxidase
LVDQNGRRFMTERHPWAELAPRDVAARAIFDEQARGNKVFLDARALNGDFTKRFPHIFQACREHGLDPRREPLPVTPAAHFLMGGVAVDLYGASSLPGLYACGEAARTGAHGANRLASNSLLEALVFGRRTAQALAASPALPGALVRPGGLDAAELEALLPPSRPLSACLPGKAGDGAALTAQLREAMWRSAGLVRRGADLRETLKLLADLERRAPAGAVGLYNMITTARLAASAALARRESRGGHFRSDYPHADASLAHVAFSFSGCEVQNEPIAAPRNS